MIRKLKYAILSDIGTFDLKYYEQDKEVELIKLCTDNGISYLPDKSREFAYKLDNGKFKKTKISDQLKVNPYDLIFDKETIDKFREVDHNEIRFIMENGLIKGVVHIVDYNSDYIGIELFKALLEFEQNLRQLLVNEKKTNKDFIEWVRKRAEKEEKKRIKKGVEKRTHWETRIEQIDPEDETKKKEKNEERKNASLFQTFNLRELLHFATNIKALHKDDFPLDDIGAIRNLLAHNKDITNIKEEKEEGNTVVYHFEGLEQFVEQMHVFFKAFEVLEDTMRGFK